MSKIGEYVLEQQEKEEFGYQHEEFVDYSAEISYTKDRNLTKQTKETKEKLCQLPPSF